MKVIIAEKPSVAKNIAEAVKSNKKNNGFYEGSHYIVTWAFGHLLELLDAKEYDSKMSSWRLENYPFIPIEFEYKVKSNSQDRSQTDEGALRQIEIIKSLINREDVSGVISACDYDREGQIIGDIILDYLKVDKDVDRLLLNEWTPTEVENGLKNLISNVKMRPLRDAGISRQWADWIIGINLTSVATLKYQRGSSAPLNIGRVLLPTLKIIYDRDKEIENFVPEAFYKLIAVFKTKQGEEYEGIYTLENNEKFPEEAHVKLVSEAIQGTIGKIIDKQVEQKKEYPPNLFNLSNLQGHISSKYKGWTSDQVLKVAQSLYEKKYITYPRTSSIALEESLTGKAEKVLNILKKGLPYENEILFINSKRVFDNSKVESHSAIIPTYLIPKSLNDNEKTVYEAIKNRFIMQFMPVAQHEEATITTRVDVEISTGNFISKGRIQLVKGWKKVENIQSKDKNLPTLDISDEVTTINSKVDSKKTLPPKRHTEKTLLRIMETCGKKYKEDEIENNIEIMRAILNGFSIGTAATRAETIKKLKSVGYIETQGKNLITTNIGKKLVEKFPVKELFDLEYTGRLEKTLSEIGKGNIKKEQFMDEICDFTKNAITTIKEDKFHIINNIETDNNRDIEILGQCPICKGDILEGSKGYGCSNWKAGCKYVIWKKDKFLASLKVRPTKEVVKKLLKDGKVYGNQFVSKKGKRFEAYLSYEKNEENDYFSWIMKFP
ncbi:type IA DNA topoisomerase [Alkalibaculum sporogenes]|uniref:type IA DNA topoisomerase n=1 Tax=Alkalibaculum sporogenes TaxID=2655001 RepID=UPI00187BC137|nr:type IA DNA topoisomerase [Alkalibaculum sporogenes]